MWSDSRRVTRDRGRRRRRLRSRSVTSSESSEDEGQRRPGSASASSDHPTSCEEDGEALSFEHLEAVRNIALITRNEYPLAHFPRERLFKPDDAHVKCECSFPEKNEADKIRCDDVSCLNYATYIECSPSRCDAGKYCQNQRLQNPQLFPAMEAFKTPKKGYGVRTRQRIAQGAVIGEYVGEVIDQKELSARLRSMPRTELNFYYLALEPGVYIDARNKGSFTRFVNHSCEPNCKTEKWTVKGEVRIAVLAIRDISAREELTFDYQWQSLGSKQITCFCGADTCKGVIGTEAPKIQGPRGVFREPTKDECGAVLEGRRIRLFLSATDSSVFTIALVRRYIPDDETYELEYEDTAANSPEDVFAPTLSPTSSSSPSVMDEQRSQQFVPLSERTWHLYVELEGLSEDQIEQAVFAIPKRRPSGSTSATTEGSSPSKERLNTSASGGTTAATSSPSLSATPPSSTPGSGFLRTSSAFFTGNRERRNHDGELVDAENHVITTRLLVKGIPSTCKESTLRGMFVDVNNRRSSTSIVLNFDMFFFDDESGWALVEFTDAKYPSIFAKNLNGRQLAGKSLRAFHAGRKEMDGYYRMRRNVSLRRQDRREQPDTNGRSNRSSEDMADVTGASPATAPVAVPYSYGRVLNWLATIEHVEDSPIRRRGLSQSSEETLRAKAVRTVIHLVKVLRLEREDATSAVIALHRYFTFQPLGSHGNVEYIAAAMLHVFLKAHARTFPWPAFVSEAYAARSNVPSSSSSSSVSASRNVLDPTSSAFKHAERQIMEKERPLVEGLLYDLSREDPYTLLECLTSFHNNSSSNASNGLTVKASTRKPGSSRWDVKAIDTTTPTTLEAIPAEIQKEAKHLIPVALVLPIWVYTRIECVVLSLLYLSTALQLAQEASAADDAANRAAPGTTEAELAREAVLTRIAVIPAWLPRVHPTRNEAEALALLECSLSLADSLKERWIREEKTAKAVRDSRARAQRAPDQFDTDQFAVHRHPPVEITRRISDLLKIWIQVGPTLSSSSASTPTVLPAPVTLPTACLITFDALRHRLLTHSRSRSAGSSQRDVTKTTQSSRSEYVAINACDALQRIAKSALSLNSTTGSRSSVLPPHNAAPEVRPAMSWRLHTGQIQNVAQVRKRAFLGHIDQTCGFDIAGRAVYLEPWPSRDHEPVWTSQGGLARSCARELSTALMLFARAPQRFLTLLGIVFPRNDVVSSDRRDDEDVTQLLLEEDLTEPSTSRLNLDTHYLAYEQPLHVYSTILEARVAVPLPLRKRAVYDLLQALVVCHDAGYVHRFVAPQHLYVFRDGVRLGGGHAVRRLCTATSSSGSGSSKKDGYEMSERERKDQCCGSWVQVAPPEVLLGDNRFTWRGDIWSAGCVALAILLGRSTASLLQGMDRRGQLRLIFRLCGTPGTVWKAGTELPRYEAPKSTKQEYRSRLRKTLMEVHEQNARKTGNMEMDMAALDVLEVMLQLDPMQRKSARRLLEMPFFSDCVSNDSDPRDETRSVLDFNILHPTFPGQQKRFAEQIAKSVRAMPLTSSSSSKRRRSSVEIDSVASSGTTSKRAHDASRSSSKQHRSRGSAAAAADGRENKGNGNSTSMRHSSSQHHRRRHSLTRSSGDQRDSDVEMAMVDEDVPLPPSFSLQRVPLEQPVVKSESIDGQELREHETSGSTGKTTKRPKLGWGMGLNGDM